jgi:hypothetical protein
MRNTLAILTLLFLSWVLASTAAQPSAGAQSEAPYAVYLFNHHNRQYVQVGLDANTASFELGRNEDMTLLSGVAVSDDGRLAAYCFYHPSELGEAGTPITVMLRDVAAGETVAEVALGLSDGCHLERASLSPDGQLVSVGLVNPSTVDTESPAWRLVVLDAGTGEIAFELNADVELARSTAGLGLEMNTMPVVRYFGEDSLIFAQYPWFTEGPPEVKAFRWNWTAGTLEPVAHWGKLVTAYLPATGELAFLDVDDTLPFAIPAGPFPAFNVVRVMDADGEVRTVYHNGEFTVSDVLFINNGREVAMSLLPATDLPLDHPENPGNAWVAVNRAGEVRTLLAGLRTYVQLAPAPDGFVMLGSEQQAGSSPVYHLTYLADGESVALWQGDTGFWSLGWTPPITPATDLAPFSPIN